MPEKTARLDVLMRAMEGYSTVHDDGIGFAFRIGKWRLPKTYSSSTTLHDDLTSKFDAETVSDIESLRFSRKGVGEWVASYDRHGREYVVVLAMERQGG